MLLTSFCVTSSSSRLSLSVFFIIHLNFCSINCNNSDSLFVLFFFLPFTFLRFLEYYMVDYLFICVIPKGSSFSFYLTLSPKETLLL